MNENFRVRHCEQKMSIYTVKKKFYEKNFLDPKIPCEQKMKHLHCKKKFYEKILDPKIPKESIMILEPKKEVLI